MMMVGLLVIQVTILLLFLGLPSHTSLAAKTDDNDHNNSDDNEADCGIYLAPSAIPGAGLGMYSGNKPIKEGEHVVPNNNGGGDVIIPLIEMEWHTGYTEDSDANRYFFLWDEYTWSWSNFEGMEDEITEPTSISVASGGFGAAINCDLALVNVHETDHESLPGGKENPLWTYRVDASGVSSATSPGTGAFSIFHGRAFSASKDIEPYSELYASYGDSYFETRSSYWFVPVTRDYPAMDRFLKRYSSKLDYVIARKPLVDNDKFQSDLWDIVVDVRDMWRSRQMFALPGRNTTLNKVKSILENGGTAMKGYNATIKDAKWMKEHGQCMDNIMDGVSSIPHAGRGAFAKRRIRKGSVVAPAPLIHIPHRKVLDMYAPVYDEAGEYLYRDMDSGPTHQQLILNYCFGHSGSELLLCPYGFLTGLINHSPNPNTKVQWTNTTAMKHPEWLNQPVKEWGYEYHSGLGIDYVAIRDIEKGEEVTIDYGPEWEAAWKAHVERFEANPPRKDYRAAYELNAMLDVDVPIWPDQFRGVIMGCRNEYLERRGIYNEEHVFVDPYLRGIEDEQSLSGEFFLCRAIYKNEETNTYTVEVYESGDGEASSPYSESFEVRVQLVLFEMPVDAFVWRDVPYERSHHMEWSFRHHMGFEDFPDQWITHVNDSNDEL
jgi:SET domain